MPVAYPTINLNSDTPQPPAGKTNVVFQESDSVKVVGQANVTAYVDSIEETQLSLSDVTTANSSTSQHGFLKKLDGSTSHFMRGDGTWAAAAAGALFEMDETSTSGWTTTGSGSLTANHATTGYSPFDFDKCLAITDHEAAYQNLGQAQAGCVFEFDVAVDNGGSQLMDVMFGCDSSGAGSLFRLEARSPFHSGIGSETGWNSPSGPSSGPTLAANTWYHVKLVISKDGNSVTWYLNGVVQQKTATANTCDATHSYFGFCGDSGSGTLGQIANLRIYAG